MVTHVFLYVFAKLAMSHPWGIIFELCTGLKPTDDGAGTDAAVAALVLAALRLADGAGSDAASAALGLATHRSSVSAEHLWGATRTGSKRVASAGASQRRSYIGDSGTH